MKLTTGNIKILLSLEKWGILGLGQMDGILSEKVEPKQRLELFFNALQRDGYRGTTYKAMIRAEEAGWVAPRTYTNLQKLYTLTAKGQRQLKEANLSKRDYLYFEVAETLVRHELLVSGIGLVLSHVLGLRVSTESERQRSDNSKEYGPNQQDSEISDLWINDPVQPKAVEVERTQKSKTRYKKLWQDYRIHLPANAVVLYIVCFPGGASRLLSWARTVQADHVYFCDLEVFKSSLGRGPFTGYRGGWIALEPAPANPQGPALRRAPVTSLSAGQDASARERHLTVACAAPSRPEAGTHSLPLLRQGLFASPPPSRADGPRPHPLWSPSPSPEGDWRPDR